VPNAFLWLAFRDGKGTPRTLTLGPVWEDGSAAGGWRFQSAPMPALAQPVEFLSFRVYEPKGPDQGTQFELQLDDLQVTRPDGAGGHVIDVLVDFEYDDGWTGMPTSEGLDVGFDLMPEVAELGSHRGERIGSITLGRGLDGGERGIYRSTGGGPLPVAASRGFLRTTGIDEGEAFVGSVAGSKLPIRVAATVDYFPTLFPSEGGFLVADLDAILGYLDSHGAHGGSPDEVFVLLDADRYADAVAEIKGIYKLARVDDRRDLEASSLLDPLTVAGWRGVGVVALGITVTVATLGYVTYLGAYARRTRGQSAFARALGLSRGHHLGVMLVEHLLVGALGAGLGVSSGLAVSRIAVASVAHSESGRELVPPFILQTEWTPIVLMLAGLAVAGGVALVGLIRGFARAPLHDLTRLHE